MSPFPEIVPMQKHWKGLVLLAVVAAASALLGGMLSALRESNPTSASEPGEGSPAPATDPAGPDAGVEASRNGPEARDDSPWGKIFGGSGSRDKKKGARGGGLFGGGSKDSGRDEPAFLEAFRFEDPDTRRIELVSASEGLPTGGEWRGRPAFGDLDRDGSIDIVTSIRKGDGLHVFYGDGRGGWMERVDPFPDNLGYGGSDVADLNDDGSLDIVFATHGTPAQVYLGDGKGGWTASTEGCVNPQILEDVSIGDFDGDGHLDFVGIGWAHGGVYLMRGDGTGKWETIDLWPGDEDAFGHEIESGDVDGDGKTDFAVTLAGPKVFLADGKGGFRSASRSLPVPETRGTNFGIALGDVTGDGTLELAVCFTAMEGMRGIAVYDRAEDGAWVSISAGLPEDTTFADVEFGDFDGDGELDLVAMTDHNVLVWRGDGGKSWTPMARYGGDLGRTGDLAAADLNGDGRSDLILVHRHGASGVLALLSR